MIEIDKFLEDWKKEGSPTMEQVQLINGDGPYITKADASLYKLFELTPEVANRDFFKWENPNLPDIRGFRIYTVLGQSIDKTGGTEFHRQRQEIVWCISGSFEWICEDLYGRKKTHKLTTGIGLWIPPFILHTFESKEENSSLVIACNTLFNVSKPETHDTWDKETFESIKLSLSVKD